MLYLQSIHCAFQFYYHLNINCDDNERTRPVIQTAPVKRFKYYVREKKGTVRMTGDYVTVIVPNHSLVWNFQLNARSNDTRTHAGKCNTYDGPTIDSREMTLIFQGKRYDDNNEQEEEA